MTMMLKKTTPYTWPVYDAEQKKAAGLTRKPHWCKMCQTHGHNPGGKQCAVFRAAMARGDLDADTLAAYETGRKAKAHLMHLVVQGCVPVGYVAHKACGLTREVQVPVEVHLP